MRLLSSPADQPFPDSLPWWITQYFVLHVTTSHLSQIIQLRDLSLLYDFLQTTTAKTGRAAWTPAVSNAFMLSIQTEFSDRTVDRVIAHLKRFSKWIHKLAPFPMGDPMAHITRSAISKQIKVNKALTPGDRRKILRAADELPKIAGNPDQCRKGYRPYRNRAIIYTLIETGMTRSAITKLDLQNVNHRKEPSLWKNAVISLRVGLAKQP